MIACIVSGRKTKKISSILELAIKTVEGYIENILRKISRHSQECIRDFVENSVEYPQVKEHYFKLIEESYFKAHLKRIAELNKGQVAVEIDNKPEILSQISQYLRLAKIEVSSDTRSGLKTQKIKILQSEDEQLESNDLEELSDTLFIDTNNREHNISTLRLQLFSVNNQKQVYNTVFEIIKILLPNIEFKQIISDFWDCIRNLSWDRRIETKAIINNNMPTSFMSFKKKILSLCLLLIGCGLIYAQNIHTTKITNATNPVSYFVNHVKPMREMQTNLNKYGRVDVVGTSGIGKTQLIRMYVYEHKNDYNLIWFFDCNLDLNDEFARLAKAINKANKASIIDEDPTNAKVNIMHYLAGQKNWLLVFDNLKVKENGKVKDLMEWEHNGNVIFGSQDIGGMAHVVKSEPFDDKDVSKVVSNILDSSDPEVAEFLIKEFKGYPVMIVQGAQLLNKIAGISVEEYKKKIHDSTDKLQTNVQLALEQLSPTAKNLVQKIALMNNQSFSKNLLKLITNSPDTLDDDIYQISQFALISVDRQDKENPIFEMHDVIVDKVLIIDNSADNNQKILNEVINRISDQIPKSETGQYKFLKENSDFKNNLEVILVNAEKYGVSFESVLKLRSKLMVFYMTTLDYYNCEKMEQWFVKKEQEGDFDLAKMSQDARIYYANYNLDIGMYEDFAKFNFIKGLEYCNKASVILKGVKDEPELKFSVFLQIAQANAWGADIKKSQYNLDEAKKIRDTYANIELDMGEYWFIIAKLALLQGKYQDALAAIDKDIEAEAHLGQDTLTAPTYILQTEILNAMGEYDKAYPIIQRIYDQELKGKKADHEFHARLLTPLANTEAHVGKLASALKHIDRACEIFEAEIKKHSDEDGATSNYSAALLVKADVLALRGEYKQAVDFYQKAEAVFIKRYAENFGKTEDIAYLLSQGYKASQSAKDEVRAKYFADKLTNLFGKAHPRANDIAQKQQK